MYCCYLSYFIRFLFFTLCLLYVNVRMNMYVMFLLRQQRLNKLIIIAKLTGSIVFFLTQMSRICLKSTHNLITAVAIGPDPDVC